MSITKPTADDEFVDSGALDDMDDDESQSQTHSQSSDGGRSADARDERQEKHAPVTETFDSGVDVCLAETFADSLRVRNDLDDETERDSKAFGDSDVVESAVAEDVDDADDGWPIYFRQDQDGNTQLHIAIFHRLTNAVLALLDMCPHPVFLDVANDSGYAAIHVAVLTQQPQIVRRLLIAGAKVNTRDANGNTALHLASYFGDLASLEALTSPLGAPIAGGKLSLQQAKARTLPQALNQKNYDGETCVHVAAKAGQVQVLRHLMWFGADINSKENKAGRTALHIALESGHKEMLEYLVKECASICNIRTYAGHTALQLANAESKKLLLKYGYARQEDESDLESDGYDSDSSYNEDDDDMVPNRTSNLLNYGFRTGEAINVA